jgi:hypothetical protein
MKTAIQAELPEQLVADARAFVEQGWVGNFDELLADALRRYWNPTRRAWQNRLLRRTWPGVYVAENERLGKFQNEQ